MQKRLEVDAQDLTLILEGFVKNLPTMTREDKIDLAARLKAAKKHIETIDEHVKEVVKKRLQHKQGMVFGNLFKAVLTLVPTSRLDQKALKEDDPEIHAAYCKPATDERVTFEPR